MRSTMSSKRPGWLPELVVTCTPPAAGLVDGEAADALGLDWIAGGTLGAGGAGLLRDGCGCGAWVARGGGGGGGLGEGFGDGLGGGGTDPLGWMKSWVNMISEDPPQHVSAELPPAAPMPTWVKSELRMFPRCAELFMNALLTEAAALDSGPEVQPMFSPADDQRTPSAFMTSKTWCEPQLTCEK